MNASLGSLPDSKGFKYVSEQEEIKDDNSGYSHNYLNSHNSHNSVNPYDSDSTSEVSTLSYPFLLNISYTYDEGKKVR